MTYPQKKRMNRRAKILMILFVAFFCVFVIRIGHIQMSKEVNGHDLLVMAEERWTKKQVIQGKRGTIFDRSGDVLAEEIPSYTLVAILDKNSKNRVEDPRMTAEKLAPVIDRPRDEIERLLSQDRFQVELGPGTKNLSFEKKEQIKELELPGITFIEEPRRYYPKQTFASHVIGYTERDMSKARMGLESSLNELLLKENGSIEYKSDRRGIKLPAIEEIVNPAKDGFEVYLTLDSNIQMALEQAMSQVEERYQPERMMAVVADPKTGEILAMSNRPSFNPNFYEQITNYTNYTISSRFEPGSTMKIFSLAAAIEEGVYQGDEYYQSGSYQIGGRRVRDHNQGRGWGQITFDEGFQRSSNVAFSILALEKLGPERLYHYLDQFRFREPTGIDLPNEATSLIADSYRIDAATTAFGQASAITPIQQVQAATAIANGGKMMQPYVIDRIVDPNTGKVISEAEPKEIGTPISEETATRVLELMETVVTSPAGTGKPYYIEGFEVAGKTGTAEIPRTDGPGYIKGHGQYIFSFLGVAPKSDPKLIVYVAVDRPKLEDHEVGSAPVSQIFNQVMKHSLQYLNISPRAVKEKQNEIEDRGLLIEDYVDESTKDIKEQLQANGFNVYVLGNGTKIEDQSPKVGTKLIEGEKVFLRTNDKVFQMPNVNGWSFRDVMKLSTILELNANIIGSGFVTKQSIPPNNEVKFGDYIAIELKLPTTEETEILDENGESEYGTEDETITMD